MLEVCRDLVGQPAPIAAFPQRLYFCEFDCDDMILHLLGVFALFHVILCVNINWIKYFST